MRALKFKELWAESNRPIRRAVGVMALGLGSFAVGSLDGITIQFNNHPSAKTEHVVEEVLFFSGLAELAGGMALLKLADHQEQNSQ